MTRPERKLKSLTDKIAEKESRTKKGAGKRLKRWKKAAAKYQPVAAAA